MSEEDQRIKQKAILNKAKLILIDDNNMAEDGYKYSGNYRGFESAYSHSEEEACPGYYAASSQRLWH